MATVIKLKRGTTTPTTSNIVSGEIAVDTSAQKLYINDASTIKTIGLGNPSVSDISDLTATATELNYTDGVTSNIQTQLDAKLASSSYTAADVLSKLLTVDGAGSGLDADLLDGISSASFLRSDATDTASGNLTLSGTVNVSGTLQLGGTSITSTAAELNYLDGVTSNIQTQLDAKVELTAVQLQVYNSSGTLIKIRVGLASQGSSQSVNIKNSAGTIIKTLVGPFITADPTL